MSMRGWYGEHLRQTEARFAARHPGAERTFGDTGKFSYPYIAYHESNTAAFLELCSILAVVFGLGLMIVLPTDDSDAWAYAAWIAGIAAVNRLLAMLARIVNDAQVRQKISTDAEYARYFAVKYPEQARLCEELNEIYALDPDAVPAEEIRAQIQADAHKDDRLKRIITVASIGFLLLMFLALMAFCIWAMKENI